MRDSPIRFFPTLLDSYFFWKLQCTPNGFFFFFFVQKCLRVAKICNLRSLISSLRKIGLISRFSREWFTKRKENRARSQVRKFEATFGYRTIRFQYNETRISERLSAEVLAVDALDLPYVAERVSDELRSLTGLPRKRTLRKDQKVFWCPRFLYDICS